MKQCLLLFFALMMGISLFSQNEIIYDSTFSQDGRASFLLQTKREKGLLLQPDGKIVLFGETRITNNFENSKLTLARIKSNGNLDSTFNNTGSVTTTITHNWYFEAVSGLLQADGKIVIGGNGSLPNAYNPNVILYRYQENGKLDSTFGTNGLRILKFDSLFCFFTAIKILEDSKILVLANGVYAGSGSYIDKPLLYRLLPDGNPDNTFGNNGVIDLSNAGMTRPYAMALNPDNRIYITGVDTVLSSAARRSLIIRLDPDGNLDNTFHFKLMLGTTYPGYISSLAVQPDGKILAGGEIEMYTVLLRLNPDGSLDQTFSRDGFTLNIFNVFSNAVDQMIVKPDGKILIEIGSMRLCQFNANGSLDYNFDLDGRFFQAPTANPQDLGRAYGIVLQPDGKILAGATLTNRFFVARFVNRLDQ